MKHRFMKLQKIANSPLTYEPQIDVHEFRLVSEPTADAIKNDVEKFYNITTSAVDATLLGRFLLGVSLIKLKKIIGNASRGATAKGDIGWMAFKKTHFAGYSNNMLTDAVNFAGEVFTEWDKSLNLHDAKLAKSGNWLTCGDPIAFQVPEERSQLKGLLAAIRDTMDGKKMTAFCRSIGRIRDAVKIPNPTGYKKPAPLTDKQKELLDPLRECENELVGFADENDLSFAECDSPRLARFENVLRVCLTRVQTILKARKKV